ncbi:MAG: hypothetical protein PUD91_01285 [Bacteroidales bacterium]|nr:hypothetical protein [Bacteroidales bacterium]
MKCEAMMMSVTEKEMIDLWKLKCGYTTPRRDCYLERDDDVELDELLVVQLRAWYAGLLLTAPPHLLPVEDVSTDCTVAVEGTGAAVVTLPERCVRPLAVRISGWESDATEFHSEGSAAHKRQSVEWLRGTLQHPVAIAGERELRLYPVPDGVRPTVLKARCVVRPKDGSYSFATSLLDTLPAEWNAAMT